MDDEHTNKRMATYSLWHRPKSIRRYLSNPDDAHQLACIDIDEAPWIEWDRGSREPLALIETARDSQDDKSGNILRNLARMADLPCFIVLYTPGGTNPAYPQVPDILRFRVRRLWPNPETVYRELTCREYAEWLKQLRQFQVRAALRKQNVPLLEW